MFKAKPYKIAVASGKGGTGKTFVATNLFRVLKDAGKKVTLIDCDAEAPNSMAFFNTRITKTLDISLPIPYIDTELCTFCGKCHEYCNYNAIFFLPNFRIIKVIEELCHSCGACLVACNDGAITEKQVKLGEVVFHTCNEKTELIEARTRVGVMTPVPVIKAAIKEMNKENEIAIMDAPPGTSCPFIHTVNSADYVILVTEPTPFGLSDLKRSVDTLRQMDKLYGVIVNRAGIGDESVYGYLEDENIELLAEIPFDKRIAQFYSRAKLLLNNMPSLKKQLYETFEKTLNHGTGNNQR